MPNITTAITKGNPAGADLNQRDIMGRPALLLAVKDGRVDVAIRLVSLGADVRMEASGVNTMNGAMMYAPHTAYVALGSINQRLTNAGIWHATPICSAWSACWQRISDEYMRSVRVVT
jgi:ankyrin repeat protein